MKKTFLTFIAVGFGFSVAFAQTAPTEESQQGIQTEQTQVAEQGEANKKKVEMSELPQAVQDAFSNGQYSDLQVLAIYELSPEPAADPAIDTESAAAVYEFELAKAEEGEAADAGTTDDGLAGVETERVSERQPDIVLQIDENGQVVEEKDLDEEGLEK
jgi:hypothetical protein